MIWTGQLLELSSFRIDVVHLMLADCTVYTHINMYKHYYDMVKQFIETRQNMWLDIWN